MNDNILSRSPLKEINKAIYNNQVQDKPYTRLKRKKECSKSDSTIFEPLLNNNFNILYKQVPENSNIDKKSFDSTIVTNPSTPKCFKEYIYPQLSPFSEITYSCSSANICHDKNHKVDVKQIEETTEKSIIFLAKSWYLIRYPLTCLISENTHLSPYLLRYLLFSITDENDETLCLRLKEIIKGHIKLHPPCNQKLKNLYHHALTGSIEDLEPSYPDIATYDFQNVLISIGKALNELKVINQEEEKGQKDSSFKMPKTIDEFFTFFSDNLDKTGNILPMHMISSNNEYEEKDTISPEGIIKRLFMVLSVMIDIIEEDFRMWWMRYFGPVDVVIENSSPIIQELAWNGQGDKLSVNDHCIEVFKLFKSCPREYKPEIARYIAILSEMILVSQLKGEKSFALSNSLCHEFAEKLSEVISVDVEVKQETVSLIQLIDPPWLKYKVCASILKIKSSENDDLGFFIKLLQNKSRTEKISIGRKNKCTEIPKNLISKVRKVDSAGETIIHKYCRKNNHKALGTLLKYKDINVNIADNRYWTPLHNAATYNSVECVKLLVKNCLIHNNGANNLDLFALNDDNDTPLSCAVREENEEIVNILLNNGGGITVYDIDSSGYTTFDLATTESMKDILDKGWTKSFSTYHNLNMTNEETDLIYYMLTCYIKIYYIRDSSEIQLEEASSSSTFNKSDCIRFSKDLKYFVALYELVKKLCSFPLNPKKLKNILYYLNNRRSDFNYDY